MSASLSGFGAVNGVSRPRTAAALAAVLGTVLFTMAVPLGARPGGVVAGPSSSVTLRHARQCASVRRATARTIVVPVVVDTGGPSDTAEVACVPVPAGSNGAQVLAARAKLLHVPAPRYAESGLLCAIDGYPATGCGVQTGQYYAYWAYYHGGSSWTYASVGPAEWKVIPRRRRGLALPTAGHGHARRSSTPGPVGGVGALSVVAATHHHDDAESAHHEPVDHGGHRSRSPGGARWFLCTGSVHRAVVIARLSVLVLLCRSAIVAHDIAGVGAVDDGDDTRVVAHPTGRRHRVESLGETDAGPAGGAHVPLPVMAVARCGSTSLWR